MKRSVFILSTILTLALASPLTAQQRRPPSGGGGSGGGQAAAPRSGGGSGGGGQVAAPRSGGSSGHPSSPPPSSGGAVRRGAGGGMGPAPAGQARPRGTAPVYGQAVPRSQYYGSRIVVPARYYGVSPWYYYSPYVYGAFGIGYWGWDPYWWGYPYYSPWPGYWGYPYGYGGYSGGYYYDHADRGYGSLRLKVKPKEAEVYADGYYMGQVDDFDGSWSHLELEAGPHRIEVRAPGYQPLIFEMQIAPGRSVTYSGELRRQ